MHTTFNNFFFHFWAKGNKQIFLGDCLNFFVKSFFEKKNPQSLLFAFFLGKIIQKFPWGFKSWEINSPGIPGVAPLGELYKTFVH